MTGRIPPGLSGMLVRNGPNPSSAAGASSWWSGDGMVHAVHFDEGRALGYSNRWVRTSSLAARMGVPRPRGPREMFGGPANANVVFHAGQLLALGHSGLPYRLSSTLATQGTWDADGMLTEPISPLPRRDPLTGAMACIGCDAFDPPCLRYYELDAAGVVVHSTEIPLRSATMQHGFGITETRIALLDLPVTFDLELAMLGALPLRWEPALGTRVGVLDRGGSGGTVQWLDLEPSLVLHVMNAWDDGSRVQMDVCNHGAALYDPSSLGQPVGAARGGAVLERWIIDPLDARLSVTQLDDRPVEWPSVDAYCTGRRHHHGYCAMQPASEETGAPGGLVRYDLRRGEATTFVLGAGQVASEPVFVRAPDGRTDEEGWVLSFVYDATRDASDVVILDATRFSGPPEATVHLPVRVPFGPHGSWVPAGALG